MALLYPRAGNVYLNASARGRESEDRCVDARCGYPRFLTDHRSARFDSKNASGTVPEIQREVREAARPDSLSLSSILLPGSTHGETCGSLGLLIRAPFVAINEGRRAAHGKTSARLPKLRLTVASNGRSRRYRGKNEKGPPRHSAARKLNTEKSEVKLMRTAVGDVTVNTNGHARPFLHFRLQEEDRIDDEAGITAKSISPGREM